MSFSILQFLTIFKQINQNHVVVWHLRRRVPRGPSSKPALLYLGSQLNLYFLQIRNLLNVREPCKGCAKSILTHQPHISCTNCTKLSHFKCSQSSGYEYKITSTLSSPSWFCSDCNARRAMVNCGITHLTHLRTFSQLVLIKTQYTPTLSRRRWFSMSAQLLII